MTLIEGLVSEIGNFLSPLGAVLDDPVTTDHMLIQIGANAENAGGDQLVNALRAIAALGSLISTQASQQTAPSFDEMAVIFETARNTFTALDALSNSSGPAAALEGFGRDLLDFLLVVYLANWRPLIREFATLLTLIEPAETQTPSVEVFKGDTLVRSPFQIDRIHLERLPALLRDPVGTLRAYYWNGLQTEADADAIADKLFVRLRNVLLEMNVDCRYGIEPGDAALFGGEAPLVDHALLIYASNKLAGADVDAGVALTLSPAEHGDLGLVVTPFGTLEETAQFGLWQIAFQFSGDLQAFAIGRNGPTLLASAGTVAVDVKITATLAPSDSGPAFVYGSPAGTRLEIGGAQLSAEVSLSETQQTGGVSAGVSKSKIVIAPGDGDGFLRSVLPAKGLEADFDLGIAWSKEGGLRISGAAGLDATLPIGLSLGGVFTVPTIHVGLQAEDAGLTIELSASVGLLIGPVQALVDRLGLTTAVTFPSSGGNVGVADLALGFKPPSGVGLAIDSAGVSGGGFLSFDEAKHEYAGVLQLEFTELALQAFGLITTQVAGGSGYSLLALIDAEFPPVQLGWGFTLNGVGGLLAVHRTADVDALRAALKADKLSTILFPKNAITAAPQLLAELDAIFPTAQGRFLFGPMALIGWGTPTVLTVALAVILELPEPIRIILIARVAARFPSEQAALIRINMDALGVLDLSQGQLSLDATLFDSKIMGYALTGDMALRANWSTQREFLLAIGGFHPQFTPPTGFPSLNRVTISMPSGPIAKLRLAAYLAVTSNTVQFGASLDVFLGVPGFGLSGHLAFDALLQLDPFHFEADISGTVALTAGGDDLMSVGLDATLSGPAPWNIAGSFKIHIIFFDVHKSFSYTWGADTPQQQIPPVQVLPLLSAALADARNWGAQLPAGTPVLVSLRAQSGPAMVAHPLAQLEVHESVAPLGLQIARLGAAAIAGVGLFTITDLQINGSTVKDHTEPVQDDFAPAQFFDRSDEEKLAGPSFERHDAGVRLNAGTPKTGGSVSKTISFETFYVDSPGALRTDPPVAQGFFFTANLSQVMSIGASARAEVRKSGKQRFQAPGKPVSVVPEMFTVTDKLTMNPASSGVTYSAAKALMAEAIASSPGRKLQIVGAPEMEAA